MAAELDCRVCCTCHDSHPYGEMKKLRPEDAVQGVAEQLQCKDCNGMKQRIAYLTKKTPSLKGALKPLNPEERKDWMAKNNKLVGEDLAKVLFQTAAESSLTKQSTEFKANGEFVDYDVVEEQFKDKPEQWASIQLNAQTHRCPIRDVMMYWIPKFTLTMANSEVEIEERKRKLESSTKMAPPKKIKPAAVNVAPAVGEFQLGVPVEQAQIQAQKVAVTPANKKRLESCIIRLETKQMELTSQMAEAAEEKIADIIPQKLHKLCDDNSKGLDKILASAKAVLAMAEAPKGDLKKLFDGIKEISATCSDLKERLEEAMKLADM